MPVPYTIAFEVAIISKNQDDGLQIIEQILPYFQPHYNLSIKLIPSMKETRDFCHRNSIDYMTPMRDFATRRAIILLSFSEDLSAVYPMQVIEQLRTYTLVSMSTKHQEKFVIQLPLPEDRDGVVVTTLTSKILIKLDCCCRCFRHQQYDSIYIGTELLQVTKKSGNNLTVTRGYENTTAAAHINGSNVYLITEADNALLDSEDDFGFGELKSEFTDMKKRNPISGNDKAI